MAKIEETPHLAWREAVELARQLERDLAALRAVADRLAEALKEANGSFCGSPQSQLRIDKALARYRAASADGNARKEEAP